MKLLRLVERELVELKRTWCRKELPEKREQNKRKREKYKFC